MSRGFVIEDSSRSAPSSLLKFKRHGFNTALCDCTEHCSSCLDVMFCPWCQLSAQYNMLNHQSRGVHCLVCFGMVASDSCFTFGCCLMGMSVFTRNQMSSQFNLTEDGGCTSCLKAFCCASCSTCQVHREMSLRSRFPGGVCVGEAFTKPGLQIEAPPALSMNYEGGGYASPMVPVPLLLYYPPQQQQQPVACPQYPSQPMMYGGPPPQGQQCMPPPPPLSASQAMPSPYMLPPPTSTLYAQPPLVGYAAPSPSSPMQQQQPYGQSVYTAPPPSHPTEGKGPS